MTKETYIKFRCSEKFKSIVEQKAKEHGRTVSGYIEYLIGKDVDTMRILTNDFTTDEMKKDFTESGHCYLSSDKKYWLFNDMSFFNQMNSKYHFDEKDIDGDDIFWNSNLQNFIEMLYEEKSIEILGIHVWMSGYAEITAEILEENDYLLFKDDWDKVVDKYLKSSIMTGVKMDLMDNVTFLIKNGFDITEIKDAISMAEKKVELENKGYEVLMDEEYWTFDENKLLQSVICIIDDKEVDTPVIWDQFGAYVEYEGVRTYVLEYTN